MTKQQQAALAAMEEWLSHPRELGKKPSKLEIAGEFDLHEMHYYICKYKKSLLGKWLVGVAGGYEDRETPDNCGHTFSEMEPYDPGDAEAKCAALVEKVRQLWMEQAQAAKAREQGEGKTGPFAGCVLLSDSAWDAEGFKAALKADWGIDCSTEDEDSADASEDGTILAFEAEGMMVAISLMECPVPNGEAEYWANSNFMARAEAVAAAQNHRAHVLAAVVDSEHSPRQQGELYVKIASTLLKAPNALGIYTNNTVWLPDYFIQVSEDLKAGHLPLMDLVFVGLVQGEKGICGWTTGLNAFGRDELEIVDSQQSPKEVHLMLLNTAGYLISENATLHDGETLGYSADQKLPITRSQGRNVEGMSLKIGF
ncbi:MAG: DUF4261 domain-containing protein [Lawsonibacter sp.]|nr:DUF4261 domain-containing protein [Lawsonibacter sp.]